MKINKNKRGFTLVELVVYVAGMIALSSVMVLIIMQFYLLYKEIISVPRSDRAGLLVVDRISREIRSSNQIETMTSQFNTTNGLLELQAVENSNTVTKKFYLQDGVLKHQENLGTITSLTPRDLHISSLYFSSVQTPVSQGVKFNIEVQFKTRNATETKTYTGFSILRESYD